MTKIYKISEEESIIFTIHSAAEDGGDEAKACRRRVLHGSELGSGEVWNSIDSRFENEVRGQSC